MGKIIKLTGEFDAQKWVDEWIRTIKEYPSIPTDEGTMLGWFANAIMAGYDYAMRIRESEKQMNIYLIKRNDDVGYDEYDSAVVIAESPERALKIAKSIYGVLQWNGWKNWDVSVALVDTNKDGLLLSSYNAG